MNWGEIMNYELGLLRCARNDALFQVRTSRLIEAIR